MPRAIQPIKVGKKTYYSVFSTIVFEFMTPFYNSPSALRKAHPMYKNLKVFNIVGGNIKGKITPDGRLSVGFEVFQIKLITEGK